MFDLSILFVISSFQIIGTKFINNFFLIPILILIYLLFITSCFLYFSLKNIFKIFFFTEAILLLIVIFLSQYGSILFFSTPFHYFYCQIILASAAAEAALFLGLFSHLYDQQFLNWIINWKNIINLPTYYTLLRSLTTINSKFHLTLKTKLKLSYFNSLKS